MLTIILVIAGSVVVVAGSFYLVLRVTAPMAKRRLDELSASPELADAELTTQASSFGVASRGKSQGRGLGVLALHGDQLRFRPVAGPNAVDIERSAITDATVGREFLGKTQNVDLLVVTFEGPDGPDEAAWRVPEPGPWLAALAPTRT